MLTSTTITWPQFFRDCQSLASQIKHKPDIVVCISRGGLVLGRLLSTKLDRPLGVISAVSYQGRSRSTLRIGTISSTTPIKGSVLLVDDLVDSGMTMKKISTKLRAMRGVKAVKTACLYSKSTSCLQPDFVVREINKWIHFPYE